MPISVATFKRVVMEDDDHKWELRCGTLVEKPGMTMEHNDDAWEILRQLALQLDPDRYRVRSNAGHMALGDDYFIPDVAVIPIELANARRGRRRELETYEEPLPFVVEVWSRSTGRFDVDSKLPAYQQRGDAVTWRVHPYERTVTVWVRGAAGQYTRSEHTDGQVSIPSLPGVAIDLDRLFPT